MKKLTALILALIMLLSCAVTAMAEFDRSVLTDETAQSLIVLEFDETNTNAYIESRLERSALAFDHPNAHPDEPSLVEFDMIVLDYHTDNPYPALRLWVRYRGTEYLYIDGISFEVDGLTYRFDGVGDPSRIYDENGKYSENALVVFGLNQSLLISGLLGYMQQMADAGHTVAVGLVAVQNICELHGPFCKLGVKQRRSLRVNGVYKMILYFAALCKHG